MSQDSKSARISPTAWYTGEVWRRNGLGFPEIGGWRGTLFFTASKPLFVSLPAIFGVPSLQDMLLERHHTFDFAIRSLIEDGDIQQFVEVAAGFSARGIRFCGDYPEHELTWIDADLPHMVAQKEQMVSRLRSLPAGYRQSQVDVLLTSGNNSLGELIHSLPSAPTALTMEGLLNYFSAADAFEVCKRTAEQLRDRGGVLLMELHARQDVETHPAVGAFLGGLSAFARGRVSLHHDSLQSAAARFRAAGFDEIFEVVDPKYASQTNRLVRVVAAAVWNSEFHSLPASAFRRVSGD